ncbi:hypothetical protein A3842_10900 [Paenibacillus sp. P3E]|nr:hypothetical protein A3842_10900 [Paenibacillus sp. P3E]
MNEIINDVYNQIVSKNVNTPYFLFGHSMGGIIAYELYYKMLHSESPLPECIIISSISPPHILKTEKKIHQLSKRLFLEEIQQYGGTPMELLNDGDWLEFIMPILRSDFRIIENYEGILRRKMNCDLHVIYEMQDELREKQMKEWKQYSNKYCTFKAFYGGHFFIKDSEDIVVDHLTQTVNKIKKQYEIQGAQG